jgi:hypothetical protein
MHSPALIQRCRNPEIQTHLLEAKVFEMIREVMLDPLKLRECMDFFRDTARPDRSSIQGQLTRIQNRATTIATIEDALAVIQQGVARACPGP